MQAAQDAKLDAQDEKLEKIFELVRRPEDRPPDSQGWPHWGG